MHRGHFLGLAFGKGMPEREKCNARQSQCKERNPAAHTGKQPTKRKRCIMSCPCLPCARSRNGMAREPKSQQVWQISPRTCCKVWFALTGVCVDSWPRHGSPRRCHLPVTGWSGASSTPLRVMCSRQRGCLLQTTWKTQIRKFARGWLAIPAFLIGLTWGSGSTKNLASIPSPIMVI